MSKIQLKNVFKKYANSEGYSVNDFNLDIEEKEFIVLVGPSGCGKSTTLRMIAGLEEISEGDFIIEGQRVNDKEPKDRDIAMVFQNYALYPHMSVFENMSFGLKIRKLPKKEIKEKVEHAAEILGLKDLLNRKPKELSGGQRQRVALGRAIVRNASIFLMDEPLSNLDAKLRVQMRAEISKLHRQLGTTVIYVTHDQTEAMTMATRIVIMKDGVIQQIGTPSEVYHLPANTFVASFIGSPGMNLIEGIRNEKGYFEMAEQAQYRLSSEQNEAIAQNENKPFLLGVRPENISVVSEPTSIQGVVDLVEVNGPDMLLHVIVNNQTILVKSKTDEKVKVDQSVFLEVDDTTVHLFDKETGQRL